MALNVLHIPGRVLRPKQGDILHCDHCDKPQARWDLTIPTEEGFDVATICALCFMYESEWGKQRRVDIDALVARVEIRTKKVFLRDPEERLLLAADADKILAGIAVQSRMREAMAAEEEEGCPSCGFTEAVESGFPDPKKRQCPRCQAEWTEE